MKDRDFEILKDALQTLQDTVESSAILSAQQMGRVEKTLSSIERRLDEVDLVHENLIGEVRQINKNLERLDND